MYTCNPDYHTYIYENSWEDFSIAFFHYLEQNLALGPDISTDIIGLMHNTEQQRASPRANDIVVEVVGIVFNLSNPDLTKCSL